VTIVTGLHRAVIEDYPSTTPYIVGTVNPANETIEDGVLLKSQAEKLSKLIMKYIFTAGLSDQLIQIVSMIAECSHLTDFFAFYLIKDVFVKQTFLETLNVNKRCEMATAILEEEIKTIKSS
jgi:ATP-dependent Lon protease